MPGPIDERASCSRRCESAAASAELAPGVVAEAVSDDERRRSWSRRRGARGGFAPAKRSHSCSRRSSSPSRSSAASASFRPLRLAGPGASTHSAAAPLPARSAAPRRSETRPVVLTAGACASASWRARGGRCDRGFRPAEDLGGVALDDVGPSAAGAGCGCLARLRPGDRARRRPRPAGVPCGIRSRMIEAEPAEPDRQRAAARSPATMNRAEAPSAIPRVAKKRVSSPTRIRLQRDVDHRHDQARAAPGSSRLCADRRRAVESSVRSSSRV